MLLPISAPRRVYVDSVAGLDTNTGYTPAAPVQTLSKASLLLSHGGTIVVRAPSTSPVQGTVDFTTAHDVRVVPWDAGATWHLLGTVGAGYALRARGAGTVTLRKARIVGQGTAGVRCGLLDEPAGTGKLVAVDCYAEGTQDGWSTSGQFTSAHLTRCVGLGGTNDGFGVHGTPGVLGTVTLVDCVGNDCGDEGASPHDDTILHIVGGEFRRNGSSGVAAVGNAVCNISGGTLLEGNGIANPAYGGVYYEGNASGTINGAVMTGNAGPGIWVNGTTGTVTLTAYTSTGNGAPDILA